MLTVSVSGALNSKRIPARTCLDETEVVSVLEEIARTSPLHSRDVADAKAFWTPERIREDIQGFGICEILICGGFYVVTITSV